MNVSACVCVCYTFGQAVAYKKGVSMNNLRQSRKNEVRWRGNGKIRLATSCPLIVLTVRG